MKAMQPVRVKLTCYHDRGKFVVNMPGTGMRPRVFTSLTRALALVTELSLTGS